jgi:hypothetical protein
MADSKTSRSIYALSGSIAHPKIFAKIMMYVCGWQNP